MKRTALVNGQILDGTKGDVLSAGTIVIEDSVIASVGPTADIPTDDCEVIDIQGKTLLPGLIDGHMHVTDMPGLMDAGTNLQNQLQASEILRECLLWGTTTVGHAGGCEENLVLRDMIDKGSLTGRSRLVVSGVVTATGGHVRGEGADGPWEIRKMVRRMALAGMDFFKTCATGGFQWAHEGLGTPDYSLEELEALVAEAHMRHRIVHVHAHAQPGIQNAIDAKCDVILHGADIDVASLEGIAARGLIYMPTLHITSERIWGNPNLPKHMTSRMKVACKPHRRAVTQAHEMGITIAAGTDGGPWPGAIMYELSELVDCGLTPQEAIMAATCNSAVALGIGDIVGTLVPGKQADLIVVDGDPLADISILTSQKSIAMVVKAGHVEVDRIRVHRAS